MSNYTKLNEAIATENAILCKIFEQVRIHITKYKNTESYPESNVNLVDLENAMNKWEEGISDRKLDVEEEINKLTDDIEILRVQAEFAKELRCDIDHLKRLIESRFFIGEDSLEKMFSKL